MKITDFKSLDLIVLKFGKEEFNLSVKELLTIDENKLISSIETTPTLYGYLSVLRSKIARQLADTEIKYRSQYGEKYLIIKEDPTWDKAPTEKHVESMLYSDKDLMSLKSKIVELNSNVSMLEGLLESLKQKVSLIQTLSANLRNNP